MSRNIKSSATVSVACSCANELGEGPIWDAQNDRVLWLDILEHRLFQLDPNSGAVSETQLDAMITSLALSRDNALLGTSTNGLERINPLTGGTHLLRAIEQEVSGNRSNDGKCDPQGRYWFGTMDNSEVSRAGALYSIDANLQVRTHIEGLGVPNTLAWSPCGEFFYFADSMAQIIWRYPWSASVGALGSPEIFVSLQGTDRYPDGSAMDSEGYLWNAQWNGWRVVRYAPDGKEDRVIDMPVASPTSCVFAGADLDRLFVTSARKGQTVADLERQPQAGSLFEIEAGNFVGMHVASFGCDTPE